MVRSPIVLSVALALSATGPSGAQPVDADVLVSPAWLAEHLHDPNLTVLHVGMGHDQQPDAWIPGAVYLDYHAIAVNRNGLAIEMPPVPDLVAAFRAVGVSNHRRVVVYGAGSAHLAARVFLTLEYLGHRGRVSVLDGGIETWIALGHPTAAEPRHPELGSFEADLRDDVLVAATDVVALLEDTTVTLIDARPSVEYTGERQGRNPRGGHLPGAYNLYWEELLVSPDEPRLAALDVVRARFAAAGAAEGGVVVNYCQIGMRASYTYLISRYLGYDARFYDGSWMEWSRHPELPMVAGAARR